MSKKKISLKVRLAIAIPLILFGVFNIVRNIDVIFPPDPMEELKAGIARLESADLEEKDELMDDIYKYCIELQEESTFAEGPIRKVVEERYNATVNSGKGFGEHDFGILLHGMHAFKVMGPLTTETLTLVDSIATNEQAVETEFSYKYIAGYAIEVSARNKVFEAQKIMDRVKNMSRDPLAESVSEKELVEHDAAAPDGTAQ